MPRPLIIKIEGSKKQSSINFLNGDIIRANLIEDTTDYHTEPIGPAEDTPKTTGSLVHDLIVKYEMFSPKSQSNLYKMKSKSLSDLQRSPAPKSTDESYKRAFSHFQNQHDIKTSFDLESIKKKSKSLLQSYRTSPNWEDQVLELLEEIIEGNTRRKIDTTDSNLESFKLDSELIPKENNKFERKLNGTVVSNPISNFVKYYTGKPFEFNIKSNEDEDINSSDSDNGIQQGFYQVNDDIQEATSGVQFNRLKSFFEGENVEFNDTEFKSQLPTNGDYRLLPEAKFVDLNSPEELNINDSMRMIEELHDELQNKEKEVQSLKNGDKDAGYKLNDSLIQILIRLDDIKTFNDSDLQTARREAIQVVQDCIKVLRVKMHS